MGTAETIFPFIIIYDDVIFNTCIYYVSKFYLVYRVVRHSTAALVFNY